MSTLFVLMSAGFALIAAAAAVTRPNVVHALLWLVAGLLALAAAFFALGAAFAGAVQILIYAGAILAVFVFVVMTYDASPAALTRERSRLRRARVVPVLVLTLVLVPLVSSLWQVSGTTTPVTEVSARQLGTLLFGPWALAVEIASCLLLAALMGARNLGRRVAPEETEP